MKKLIAVAVAATLAAPAAFAGSPLAPMVEPQVAAPAPMMAPGVDWTGPYAGVTLGFGRTSWLNDDNNEGDDERQSTGSFGGGAHIGYNLDMGNWVAGAEVMAAPGFNQSVGDREIKWGVGARLRAGPTFGPGGNTWGFGSLGVAHVRHDDAEGNDRQSANGWVLGVGVSHLLQDNIILTGEVNQARFRGDSRFRNTSVAAGVSFRF